jgi:hypothetical protein
MKKTILILITTLISIFSVQGQQWETIGSGVADFFLSNPKTADKMKPEHQIALGIIGDLLKTTGERKHEINVAEAGRSQINLNTNSGQQIQLVMDANGNVYALSNGTIYPISQDIVNEARNYLSEQPGYMDYVRDNYKGQENNQLMLSSFNFQNLMNNWNKSPEQIYERINSEEKLYIKDVVEKYGDNLYVYFVDPYETKPRQLDFFYSNPTTYHKTRRLFKKKNIGNNKISLLNLFGDGYCFLHRGKFWNLFTKIISTHYRGTFTASWVNDLNNNKIFEFEEFQDIRRNFYQNESFVIATGLYFKNNYSIKLSILEQLTGKIIHSDKLDYSNINFYEGLFSFKSNSFEPGIYTYNISFINSETNEEIKNASDKFQILALKKEKEIEPDESFKINNSNKSSSKEKMITDLIQMLKEGKISEATFKASLKALEEN